MIVEGSAIQLTGIGDKVIREEIHELKSNQEETDTRVILYSMY